MNDHTSESSRRRASTVFSRLSSELVGNPSSRAEVWEVSEYGDILQHFLATPLNVDVAGLPPGGVEQLRVILTTRGLVLQNMGDVLLHAKPPLELLRLFKEFAKIQRVSQSAYLPEQIAIALYWLSLAAALARMNERISSFRDEQLLEGFSWTSQQPWISEPLRKLLIEAKDRLAIQ